MIILKHNALISFILKHTSCVCFIYLFTLGSANALPPAKDAKKEPASSETSETKIKLSFVPATHELNSFETIQITPQTLPENSNILDLTSEPARDTSATSTTYIDFKKMKPKNKIKQIKEHYLTIYSRKKQKLKATYLQGSYAINYTQSW